MKTEADSGQITIGSCFATLGALALGAAILAAGAFEWHRSTEKGTIRANLPSPYQDGRVVRLDHCDIEVGGYSYIFELSPTAARNLRSATQARAAKPGGLGAWGDGPLEFGCLDADEAEMRRIRAHARQPGSYYEHTGHISGRLFIPSLGLIVGGYLPD
jgi:hypothetical protein